MSKPKYGYRVLVTRDATESAWVRLVASSPAEAVEVALELARDDLDIDWELDEGNFHDPYLPDPDCVVLEREY